MTAEFEFVQTNKRHVIIETVMIDPDLARKILSNPANPRNRPVSKYVVAYLLRAAKSGTWKPRPDDGVMLAKGNALVDGQHILHAIIAYGKALPVTLIRDPELEPKQITMIDGKHKERSTADQYAMEGEENCLVLAATARIAYALITGTFMGTRDEVKAYFAQDEQKMNRLRDATSEATRCRHAVKVLRSAAAVGLAMYCRGTIPVIQLWQWETHPTPSLMALQNRLLSPLAWYDGKGVTSYEITIAKAEMLLRALHGVYDRGKAPMPDRGSWKYLKQGL